MSLVHLGIALLVYLIPNLGKSFGSSVTFQKENQPKESLEERDQQKESSQKGKYAFLSVDDGSVYALLFKAG